MNKMLALASVFCYDKRVFRAGCNSRPAVTLILFENPIQTTSASPCRTQVQPAASFLVCSLIFIEYH